VALVIAGEDSSPNKSSRLSPTQSKYVWLNDYTTLTYFHPTFAPIDEKIVAIVLLIIDLIEKIYIQMRQNLVK
ncbi:MAG: hypothetical protein IJ194_08125, partial [Bacilli bacterium]|nr:hypothetical protein [Bacilli bacterium]